MTLAIDPQGLLRELRATGHANWARRGNDIVCAAATALMRTAAATFEERPRLEFRGGAGDAELWFAVGEIPAGMIDWARGVTDIVRRGLNDLECEYPKSLRVERRPYTTLERPADAQLAGGG